MPKYMYANNSELLPKSASESASQVVEGSGVFFFFVMLSVKLLRIDTRGFPILEKGADGS